MYKKLVSKNGKVLIFNLIGEPIEQQGAAGYWVTFDRFVGEEISFDMKIEIGGQWGTIMGYSSFSSLKDSTEEEFLSVLEKEFQRTKNLINTTTDAFKIYYGFPLKELRVITRALHV